MRTALLKSSFEDHVVGIDITIFISTDVATDTSGSPFLIVTPLMLTARPACMWKTRSSCCASMIVVAAPAPIMLIVEGDAGVLRFKLVAVSPEIRGRVSKYVPAGRLIVVEGEEITFACMMAARSVQVLFAA